MIRTNVTYEGGLRCVAVHGPSGRRLETDAPVDNHGRGETFSPTDLVAASLGACMMTLMGIHAERHGIDLGAARITVEKHMQAEPRRIGRLVVDVVLPDDVPPEHVAALKRAAEGCPVKRSLDGSVAVEVRWTPA